MKMRAKTPGKLINLFIYFTCVKLRQNAADIFIMFFFTLDTVTFFLMSLVDDIAITAKYN